MAALFCRFTSITFVICLWELYVTCNYYSQFLFPGRLCTCRWQLVEPRQEVTLSGQGTSICSGTSCASRACSEINVGMPLCVAHWTQPLTNKQNKEGVWVPSHYKLYITSILSLYRRSKVGIPCSEYSCSEINVWMTRCCTATRISGSLSPKSRFVTCLSEFQRFTAEICLFLLQFSQ